MAGCWLLLELVELVLSAAVAAVEVVLVGPVVVVAAVVGLDVVALRQHDAGLAGSSTALDLVPQQFAVWDPNITTLNSTHWVRPL